MLRIWGFFAKPVKEILINTGYTVGATLAGSATYGVFSFASDSAKAINYKINSNLETRNLDNNLSFNIK